MATSLRRIGLLLILLAFPQGSPFGLQMITPQAPIDASGLEPLYFPGSTLFSALNVPNPFAPKFSILGTEIRFTPPSYQGRFKKPVVQILLTMDLNGSKFASTWQNEVTTSVQDTSGCDQRTVDNFKMVPTGGGNLIGTFHIKHVKRWCVGGATGDQATIEADVTNDFSLNISDDQKRLTLKMKTSVSDNVSPEMRNAAKILGNLLAAFPLTNSLVLGLDKQVFEALDAENRSLSGRIDTLESVGQPHIPITDGNGESVAALDLVYDVSGFHTGFLYVRPGNPGIIGLRVQLETNPDHLLGAGGARQLRQILAAAQGTQPTRGRIGM
jgi:hypothetical protein